MVSDINNGVMAYDCEINGKSRRFYTPRALAELLVFLGSPDEGTWGLEQIFSKIYQENRPDSIRLTINQEWQSVVLAVMEKTLRANKEKESNNPEYKKLLQELAAFQAQLQKKREELLASRAGSQQQIMQAIIQLQDDVESTKARSVKSKILFTKPR